uniref:cytochrome c oxidase subunit II n=1 Tax=Metorchis xanthosomus TaxID=575209 RepID=UPI002551E27D|nr:cytochrome c oxidase subunit II [Metorchis xanthosomus]WGM81709.1 cytochrome c oxidase subunit 2 [Metorchis xanthosomus]
MMVGNMIYDNLTLYLLGLCTFIPGWVFLMLGWQIAGDYSLSSSGNESNTVELAWTFIPTGLVGYLCLLNLICLAEDLPVPIESIIKVIGRQWYWSYEVTGRECGYDSVMGDFVDSVDKPLRLSVYDFYQLAVTSSDVIHSFSIPELELKVDAIPGRINQSVFYMDRVGIYIGYCTELCGAGHAYMPVVIEVVIPDYKPLRWIPFELRGLVPA